MFLIALSDEGVYKFLRRPSDLRKLRYPWLVLTNNSKEEAKSDDPAMAYFSDTRILRVMRIAIAIAAPSSLLIPTVALYYINSSGGRLATIVLFTLAFSALLTIATKAKSSEIFTATAA